MDGGIKPRSDVEYLLCGAAMIFIKYRFIINEKVTMSDFVQGLLNLFLVFLRR